MNKLYTTRKTLRVSGSYPRANPVALPQRATSIRRAGMVARDEGCQCILHGMT